MFELEAELFLECGENGAVLRHCARQSRRARLLRAAEGPWRARLLAGLECWPGTGLNRRPWPFQGATNEQNDLEAHNPTRNSKPPYNLDFLLHPARKVRRGRRSRRRSWSTTYKGGNAVRRKCIGEGVIRHGYICLLRETQTGRSGRRCHCRECGSIRQAKLLRYCRTGVVGRNDDQGSRP